MWQKIKNFFGGFITAWRYRGPLAKLSTYITSFPGIRNSPQLRLWLSDLVKDISALTLLTANTIDDGVAKVLAKLIDSQVTWDVIYSLIKLADRDNGVLIPQNAALTASLKCDKVLDEMRAENPAVVIAALGLLLQLISFLKSRKEQK